MKQKKALSAVLEGRCPRCRQGKVFKHSLLDLRHFNKTNTRCSVCNWQFEVEPGFWYGAMYVSYGQSVGLFLTTALVLYYFFGDPPLHIYLIAIAVLSAITYPINFRYSRLIFLYLFGGAKYEARFSLEEKDLAKSGN